MQSDSLTKEPANAMLQEFRLLLRGRFRSPLPFRRLNLQLLPPKKSARHILSWGELRFPQLHLLHKHQFLLRRLNHLFHQPLPNLCLNRIRILGAFNDVQSLPSKCLDGLPVHGVLGNAFECVEGRGVEIYQPWARLGDVVHTSDAGGPFGCSEDGGPAHYCRGAKLLIRTSARAKRRAGACQ